MTDITEPNRIREQLSASLRTLHHGAGGAGRLGLGGAAGQRGAAVRQQAVPPVVRHGTRPRATCSWLNRPACPAAISDDALDDGRRPGRPAHRRPDAGSPKRRDLRSSKLGKWLEVRSRYLNWVDGRLAQMVIATDITPRRMAEEHRPRRPSAPVRQPPDHHGRDGIQHGARAEPAADRHQQLLQRHGERIKGKADLDEGSAGRAGKDRAPGPARRSDHPAHPHLVKRSEPNRPGRGGRAWWAKRWNWPRSSSAGATCA